MNELERSLTSDSAFAPPAHILEGVSEGLAHLPRTGAPHTLYAELWHITFWLRMSVDWCRGIETPIPGHASDGFPAASQTATEPWSDLCRRFFSELEQAAALARDSALLEKPVRCPSLPGVPTRVMTVREQLESLTTHNAYHLGRIVLLRQMAGAWPPASGGFSW
jgi:uncharacterized damage-inducible protein DinB